jgi:hypothetical protein
MGMTGADATCIVCNTHFPGGAEGFVKPGEGGTEGATFVCRWDAQDIQAQGSKTAGMPGPLDRSVAHAVLMDAMPGFAESVDDGGKTITAFLDAFYADPSKNMYSFATTWAAGQGKQAAFRQRVQANLRTAAYEDDFDSAGDAYVYEDQDGRKFTDRDIEEVKLMARDYEAWSNL